MNLALMVLNLIIMDGIDLLINAFVAVAVIGSRETHGTEEKCFHPCSTTESSSTCLSYTCTRDNFLQTECQFYSTSSSSSSSINRTSTSCVVAKDVAGFPEFCQRLLQDSDDHVPVNIFKSTPAPINTTLAEVDKEADNGKETEGMNWLILAAGGGGCFLAGCFVTCFLLTLWQKRANGYMTDKPQPTETASRERPGTILANRPAGVTSTAHRRLLSSISIDSGMSSTHVISPQNMASPSSPGGRLSFVDNGRPVGMEAYGMGYNQQSGAARIETIYSPISEGSSRDYQSIKANSEHIYSPSSEGGSSVYTNPPGHRVTVIRGSEIYQPCSEGSSNDYHCVSDRGDELSIYYASTDSYNKDYATLTDDRHTADYSDLNEQSVAKEHASIAFSERPIPATPTGDRKALPLPKDGNFSFHVKDLALPREGIPTSAVMESIGMETRNTNPYASIDMFQAKDANQVVGTYGMSDRTEETESELRTGAIPDTFVASGTSTHNLLADCDFISNGVSDIPECDVFDPKAAHKHDYYILEPEPKE